MNSHSADPPGAQDARLDQMQSGREANALAGLLGSYIDERIATIVKRMANLYRANQADDRILLGGIAQVTCMLDIISDLENRARRGAVAAGKELGNGPASPG